MTAAPQRILLLQLHHLGDVLLATPAIRTARATYPGSTIDFVTNALGAQALEHNPHLSNVFVRPGLLSIHRSRYDAVVDMHSVPRTARIVAASRARIRIGLRGRGPRNLAYTRLLPRELEAVYMARQKLRLLAPLGVEAESADVRLEIAIDAAQHEWAARMVQMHGLSGRVVAVSPVARHDFKQWGAQNWARAADALADAGLQILITSGPGEEAQARAVADAMTHSAVWQYGPTSVRQLAALYARCALWIGNDGGPKHIATAAGTRTVTVYRRNLGGVWSDPADPRQTVINSQQESLDSITPQQVINAAIAQLSVNA
jgi:heptosyltransferase-2/heptosyltransferase-3